MLVVLFLLSSLFGSDIPAQCYHPYGSVVIPSDYKPCNSVEGQFSMCCATFRANDADTCLANGLCRNYAENSQGNGIDLLWWRESCTDPTWKSPYCLQLCVTGSGEMSQTYSSVTILLITDHLRNRTAPKFHSNL